MALSLNGRGYGAGQIGIGGYTGVDHSYKVSDSIHMEVQIVMGCEMHL